MRSHQKSLVSVQRKLSFENLEKRRLLAHLVNLSGSITKAEGESSLTYSCRNHSDPEVEDASGSTTDFFSNLGARVDERSSVSTFNMEASDWLAAADEFDGGDYDINVAINPAYNLPACDPEYASFSASNDISIRSGSPLDRWLTFRVNPDGDEQVGDPVWISGYAGIDVDVATGSQYSGFLSYSASVRIFEGDSDTPVDVISMSGTLGSTSADLDRSIGQRWPMHIGDKVAIKFSVVVAQTASSSFPGGAAQVFNDVYFTAGADTSNAVFPDTQAFGLYQGYPDFSQMQLQYDINHYPVEELHVGLYASDDEFLDETDRLVQEIVIDETTPLIGDPGGNAMDLHTNHFIHFQPNALLAQELADPLTEHVFAIANHDHSFADPEQQRDNNLSRPFFGFYQSDSESTAVFRSRQELGLVQNEKIRLSSLPDSETLLEVEDWFAYTLPATTSDVLIKTFDGEDSIAIASGISNPIWVDAGDHADAVVADERVTAPMTVWGGSGNDLIVGGSGVDHLHGGEDMDVIAGEGFTLTLEQYEQWKTVLDKSLDGGSFQFPFAVQPAAGTGDFLYGDGGDDLLIGGDGDDTIQAGLGNAFIVGDGFETKEVFSVSLTDLFSSPGGVSDVLANEVLTLRMAGRDTIRGGDKVNVIIAGDGDDQITGGDGALDVIFAGNGNDHIDADFIDGSEGADFVVGGDGDDTIQGGNGINLLLGDDFELDLGLDFDLSQLAFKSFMVTTILDLKGSGDDTIVGGQQLDFIVGGNGADELSGGNGFNIAFGDDFDFGAVGTAFDFATRIGHFFIDPVTATIDAVSDAIDVVYDWFVGSEGDEGDLGDLYIGGDGTDIVFGGGGEDELYGHGGVDFLVGADNDDLIDVGDGIERSDNIGFGGDGDDTIYGGSDGDLLGSTIGADRFYGRDGDDRIYGGDGDDQLFGEAGDDRLVGGDGDDLLEGGPGDDVLMIGLGMDQVIGGDGENRIESEVVGDLDTDGDSVMDAIELLIGDGDGDSVSDHLQPSVISTPHPITGNDLTVSASNLHAIESYAILSSSSMVELPPDLLTFEAGLMECRVEQIDLEEEVLLTMQITPDMTFDSFYHYGPTAGNPTPHYYRFLFDGTTGAEILDDHIVVHLRDGMRGDDDLTINGIIVGMAGPSLNPTDYPFHNPLRSLDVNDDERISALDALNIINQLNVNDGDILLPGEVSTPILSSYLFLDTNADGRASALDALMVINQLNLSDATSESLVQWQISAAEKIVPRDDPRQVLDDSSMLARIESDERAKLVDKSVQAVIESDPVAVSRGSDLVDQEGDSEETELITMLAIDLAQLDICRLS